MAYVFVLAVLLAIVPNLVLFKLNLGKIKHDPEQMKKAQTNFFMGVAISEIIPILLIVYGFLNMEKVGDASELFAPGLLILLMVGFTVFFVFLQKKVDVEDDKRNAVNAFSSMVVPLTMVIPIVSIVALFNMMP